MSEMLIDTPSQPWTADVLTNTSDEYERQQQYNNNNCNEYDYASDNFKNKQNEFISSPKSAATSHCYSTQNSNSASNTIADASNDTDDVTNAAEEENDEFANILSLQLRKPKRWRWELSTSRSCANIALPRILLYDHKGQLLVDVNSQEEQSYNQPQAQYMQQKQQKEQTNGAQSRPRKRSSVKAATTNLAHSIRKALERQLSDLQIQEATPSPVAPKGCSAATTPTTAEHTPLTPLSPLSPAVDFYTDQLPDDDYKLRRRANSLKGVRFKVNDELKVNTDLANAGAEADVADATNNKTTLQHSFNLADLPTPPSTITTTTTVTPTNSSSSGPRTKRRYRRSHSSGRSPATSESILERFSFNKGRFSSPEFAEEKEVYRPPRYFLRTSKAGTLLVAEESFSRYRRRRRPRNSSNECLRSVSSKCSVNRSGSGKRRQLHEDSLNGLAEAELSGGSLRYGTDGRQENAERKKVLPVRRHRSDGSMLLLHQRTLSTDEDPESALEQMRALEVEKMQRAQRRRGSRSRKESKSELIITDPENDVQPGVDCSESR